MEFEPLFGELDFSRYQNVQFKNKLGDMYDIFRVIYNGRKYIYGAGGGTGGSGGGGTTVPDNGAVAVSNDFTVWQFIAPPNRWDLQYFADKTLRQSLEEIVEDTANAPIPAFKEFFSYLGEPQAEQLANMAIHGEYSSIRIAYRVADLPLIQGCSSFSEFMNWLSQNCGEAGDLIAGKFISGQYLIIPIDQYKATPVRFKLRAVPKERPNFYEEATVVTKNGVGSFYGKRDGQFAEAVFYLPISETEILLYAFDASTDKNGVTVPSGWSVYNGTQYSAANSAMLDSMNIDGDETVQYSYLGKIFYDIEYEKAEASVYMLKDEIDLSAIPSDFTATSYGFTMEVMEWEGDSLLVVTLGANEDNITVYYYTDSDITFEGSTLPAGWFTIAADGNAYIPVNAANLSLQVHLVSGESEVSDMTVLERIATYQKTETITKEYRDGTIHIMLRA